MSKKGSVSGFQFFCILFVCRIIALFTFIITDPAAFPPGDRTVVFISFIPEGLLAAVPVLLVLGPKEDRTVFTLTERLSPAAGTLCALLYAGGAVWSAAVSAVRFELFMSTVMFPGADLTVLTLLLLAAAVYTAKKGLEPIARMSAAALALIAVSLVYVCVTTAGEFEAENLEPPLQNGVLSLFTNGFSSLARTSETAALLLFAPRIHGSVKKNVFFWLIALGLTASAVFTMILGVTGAYGERQTFQLYALTVLSRIGVFERLDALICAIWMLCAFLRLSFYLFTGALFLTRGQKEEADLKRLIGLAVPVFAAYLFLSRRITLFSAVLGSGVNEAVYAALMLGLPLAIYIAYTVKENRRRKRA